VVEQIENLTIFSLLDKIKVTLFYGSSKLVKCATASVFLYTPCSYHVFACYPPTLLYC